MFQVEVLEHRLHHQGGAAEAGILDGSLEAVEQLHDLVLGTPTLLGPPADALPRRPQTARDPFDRHVLQSDPHSVLGRDRGDSGTHEARSDDRDALDRASFRAVVRIQFRIVLRRGRGEEHMGERARLGGDGEFSEGDGLDVESILERSVDGPFNDFQDAKRRRIEPVRLFHHARPRPAYDHGHRAWQVLRPHGRPAGAAGMRGE